MLRMRGRWLGVVVATTVAVGVGAAPVPASTTLGAVTPATGTVIVDPGGGGLGSGAFGTLTSGSTYIQTVDDPGQPTYAAPTAGVVTGWRAQLGAMVTSTFKLKVVRPGAGGQWTVAGESAGTHTGMLSSIDDVGFASRVPVLAGDRIGLMLPSGAVAGRYQTVATGSVSSVVGDPQGTFTPGATSVGQRLQLQATLEPDGDGDGYGDETQDACPTDPVRQSPPCAAPAAPTALAPDTTAPVLSSLAVRGGKVLFTASESAIVTVRITRLLDGRRRGKMCRAPTWRLRSAPRCTRRRLALTLTSAASVGTGSVAVDQRRLRKGRYEAATSARDAAGNVGPVVLRRFTIAR